jgi:hypothetical protein
MRRSGRNTQKQQHVTVEQAAARLGGDNASHTFTFLAREKIMAYPGKCLPHFQEVLTDPHLGPDSIVEKEISLAEVIADPTSLDEFMTVSHRWQEFMDPDPKGDQLQEIKAHLAANPSVKFVWFDWSCIPQNKNGKRSPAEERMFRETLDNLFLLFLGALVLVVMDTQSIGRFWTVYEAWLSMQGIGPNGLEPLSDDMRRVHFAFTANTTEAHAELFRTHWGSATPSTLHRRLARDDIIVTSQRDKDQQLCILAELSDRCRVAYRLVASQPEWQ